MRNLLKATVVVCLAFLVSCETEAPETEITPDTNQTVNNTDFLNTMDWPGIDLGEGSFITTYNVEHQDLDQIIDQVIDGLFSHEFENEGEFIFADIRVGGGQIIVTPGSGTVEPVVIANGDDEDCGGKEDDGWKSFGKCYSEECVKEKSEKAGEDLKESLTSGKCLDIRVKRNLLNVRVCGRGVFN